MGFCVFEAYERFKRDKEKLLMFGVWKRPSDKSLRAESVTLLFPWLIEIHNS